MVCAGIVYIPGRMDACIYSLDFAPEVWVRGGPSRPGLLAWAGAPGDPGRGSILAPGMLRPGAFDAASETAAAQAQVDTARASDGCHARSAHRRVIRENGHYHVFQSV